VIATARSLFRFAQEDLFMGESSNLHLTGLITLSLTHTTIFAMHGRFYPARRRRAVFPEREKEKKEKRK